MEEFEEVYYSLPQIDDDLLELIEMDEAGIVARLRSTAGDLGTALRRIDEELKSLQQQNPNLTLAIKTSTESIHAAIGEQVPGELAKAFMRAATYFQVIVTLRLLDLQLRRNARVRMRR